MELCVLHYALNVQTDFQTTNSRICGEKTNAKNTYHPSSIAIFNFHIIIVGVINFKHLLCLCIETKVLLRTLGRKLQTKLQQYGVIQQGRCQDARTRQQIIIPVTKDMSFSYASSQHYTFRHCSSTTPKS